MHAPNFRRAWEDCGADAELSDDYGLGVRDSLQVGTCQKGPAAAPALHLCRKMSACALLQAKLLQGPCNFLLVHVLGNGSLAPWLQALQGVSPEGCP